ncbi:MAG: hypothetical protein KDI33_06950 [Halioglobus sp.]|nr:hypothetical protein [Halioglobus sp.]MCB1729536.1 hypothetical protein [Halieaceae bacterium]
MTTRLATLTRRLAVAFAILFTLAACGGGGGGSGSFVPDESTPIAITTTSLPPVETSPYTTILEATGGSEPYTWTIEDDGGTGFTIDNLGVLTGSSPSQPGTYALTISVTGKKGATARTTYALEVTAESGIKIISTALPAAIDGLDYIALVEASGGVLPYTWAIADDGGTGLTIDNEGFLTGVAPAAGSYGITLLVTDASDKTAQQSFIFSVTGDTPQPLSIATTSLPAAAEGEPYTAILEANGGQGDYMWTLVDDGGTGLDLRDDGILSGTGPAEGDYAVTVSVTDNTRTVTSALSLAVNPDPSPLTITTTSLPGATEDVRYAAVLEATGGTENYTWSLVSGGGSGLTLTPAGVLSGTPTAPGTFGITFEVNDGENIVEGSATVTVSAAAAAPALTITTQTLPNATGPNYIATLAASGGVQPYIWTLPNDGGTGFTMSTSGVLSGTTPAPGTYTLLVSVTDDDGSNTQKVMTVTVP